MDWHKTTKTRGLLVAAAFTLAVAGCFTIAGCGELKSYSNKSLFPDDVVSVYVKMFDNKSFRRGIEYELTDALAKRIETDTPYKVVSSPDRADTVLSGHIENVSPSIYTTDRETGRALEKAVELRAIVNWKNLKTGDLLVDSKEVRAAASYSEWQNQSTNYASTLAANNLAQRIVEVMEKQW